MSVTRFLPLDGAVVSTVRLVYRWEEAAMDQKADESGKDATLPRPSFVHIDDVRKEKGIVRLPNPAIATPATAPRQADDGKDLYS